MVAEIHHEKKMGLIYVECSWNSADMEFRIFSSIFRMLYEFPQIPQNSVSQFAKISV